MIEVIEGCIFDAFDGKMVEAITHQANVDGAMGKGIALEIAARYPSSFVDFKQFKSPKLGQVLLSQLTGDQLIFHVYAQSLFPKEKRRKTNYEAFYEGFEVVASSCRRANVSRIGIPYGIGCGLGGGSWEVVYAMLNDIFGKNDSVRATIFQKIA